MDNAFIQNILLHHTKRQIKCYYEPENPSDTRCCLDPVCVNEYYCDIDVCFCVHSLF